MGFGVMPDGGDAATILSNVVGLARHLTAARIAWLMLPGEGTSSLELVAVSEHDAREQGRTPAGTVPLRVASGCDRPLAHIAGRVGEDLPIIVPFSRKVPPRVAQTALSIPVPVRGRSAGMLIVAEPFSPAGFDQEAFKLLELLAASVTNYLTLVAKRQQTSPVQRPPAPVPRQVIDALEEERRRIARDLHDEMGHALSAAILRIDLAAMTLAADATQSHDLIGRARASLVESAEALHSIVFHLRPPILEDLGLAAALNRLVAQANELADTRIVLTLEDQVRPLPEGLDLIVFRIVQEALTNIRKHARATEATVRLRYTTRWLTVRVEDNGTGPGSQSERTCNGTGLAGMRERVTQFGGTLQLETGERGGTTLVAKLPLPTDRREKDGDSTDPRHHH
jgi:signal transduction histidine kinase